MNIEESNGPPIGKLQQVNKDNSVIEEFELGVGRFSMTPKEDFYLVNFWVRGRSEILTHEKKVGYEWGPTLEILTKTYKDLRQHTHIQLEVPEEDDVYEEWEENYDSHFYKFMHLSFKNAKLEITKINENLYSIKFSGNPNEEPDIIGECKLELTDELITYW
ncbi:MAG: hypothetical protein AB8F94_13870 [Saprospiraceae bacterium]